MATKTILHENSYIRSFKFAFEPAITPKLSVVIDGGKKPVGSHPSHFSAPTCNEVDVLIYRQHHIILQCKYNTKQKISETHRTYNTFQYPLRLSYSNGE